MEVKLLFGIWCMVVIVVWAYDDKLFFNSTKKVFWRTWLITVVCALGVFAPFYNTLLMKVQHNMVVVQADVDMYYNVQDMDMTERYELGMSINERVEGMQSAASKRLYPKYKEDIMELKKVDLVGGI